MQLGKGSLDLVLVPCGLVIMFGYHLFLLYRILRHPSTTVIGYENHNKLAWVRRMVQVRRTVVSSIFRKFSAHFQFFLKLFLSLE